jgi:hypothetical protein
MAAPKKGVLFSKEGRACLGYRCQHYQSQRFLFHQGRRIEASDQVAREECPSIFDSKQGTDFDFPE